MKIIYFVQGFTHQKWGGSVTLRGEPPITCANEREAINKAERMSKGSCAGVIAAAQEFDENSDEYGKFTLLARYGETPGLEE